jgi:malonyl-CoA O-methyltransferase
MNPQRDESKSIRDRAVSYRLDKRSVRARFERAARHYDSAARVPRELGARLLEHLEPVRIEPARVLDLGAGTGALCTAIRKRYRRSQVLAVDLSESMLAVARGKTWRLFTRQRFVCADAENLPLAAECVDLVLSNATLQWCNQPHRVFSEILRLLKPGGLFMFSTLGPDTLCELRKSYGLIDDSPHVNAFMDMHDLGDALVGAGFADVVMDTARLTAEYGHVEELMRELKYSGSGNALVNRSRGLTTRAKMKRLAQAYEAHRRNGLLPATVEAVFAHAWKPVARTATSLSVAPPRL